MRPPVPTLCIAAAIFCPVLASAAPLAPADRIAPVRHATKRSPIFAQSIAPVITSLAPASGPVGTAITIQGSGFTADNSVRFRGFRDSFEVAAVRSENGTTLLFQVSTCPAYQPQCPGRYIAPGAYRVTVVNVNGSSGEAAFSLTARTGSRFPPHAIYKTPG